MNMFCPGLPENRYPTSFLKSVFHFPPFFDISYNTVDDYHTTYRTSRFFLDISVKIDKTIREKRFSSDNALTYQTPQAMVGVRELAPYLLRPGVEFLD